ncbi:hypothetical protein, partial [Actinacidiphila bryophytorum]
AVLATGALLLAACSSGGSGTPAAADAKASSSGSASASASASGSMTAYRDCLSQHGVQLPSFAPRTGRPTDRPSGRPSGRPGGGFGGFGGASADPKTQAAMKACEALRPQFSGRGGGAGGGADASAFQAFTSCLKDHGVTLPTGSPSSRPGRFGANLDTADPKVAKAYATCKPLLPQRPAPSAT